MDLRIIFPVLSMLSSGFFDLVTPASLSQGATSGTSISVHHSRTKRCSCASFLDKECVYFCHLDIIWVNTPERIVTYGLGNAPRKKRSVTEPVVPKPRCKCADSQDKTCSSFCLPNNALRYKTASDRAIPAAPGQNCAEKQCKHNLAAHQRTIRRVKKQTAEQRCPLQTEDCHEDSSSPGEMAGEAAPQGPSMSGRKRFLLETDIRFCT